MSQTPGQILAYNSYAPASQASKTTTSNTFAAVDSSNAHTGQFQAPASGNVKVQVSLVAEVSALGDAVGFALAAHGTVTPLVSTSVVTKLSATPLPYVLEFDITGLVPFTTYDFDLLFAIAASGTLTVLAFNNTSTTPTLGGATTGAPIIMTVIQAP